MASNCHALSASLEKKFNPKGLADAAVPRWAIAGLARRSGPGLTLITYRDVPWNGPWYLRHGFVELPESAWGPQLRAHWQAEVEAGLHDLGPRLVMHSV